MSAETSPEKVSGAEESADAASGEESAETVSGEESADAASGEESAEAASGEESAEAASGEESADAASGEESAEAASGEESAEAASGEESAEPSLGKTPDTKRNAQTPLEKALRAGGLRAEADALTEAGYRELADLGDEEKEVQEAVRKACAGVKDGTLRQILGLWRTSREKKPEPLKWPQLPAKTPIDLTSPTFKHDNVEYAWPTTVTSSGEIGKTASELTTQDWIAIAKRTHMTYGLHMDRAARSTHDDDARAEKSALIWKVPEGDSYLLGQAKSEVITTLSYSSQEASLIHNRITSVEGGLGVPFVAAASEVTRAEKEARVQTTKCLYMTGRSRYQAAEINLDECTELSPQFKKAVDEALEEPAAEGKCFEKLRSLFDVYGHVYPKKVFLGGQLFFCSERVVKGNVSEIEVKNTVSAAVDAKFSGVTASAKVAFSDGDRNNITAQNIQEQASFECIGGDTSLVKNPDKWQQTCHNPNLWAIIDRDELKPIVGRLPRETQEKIEKIWNQGVTAAWGHRDPPLDYVFPDFEGRPVAIFERGESGRVLTPEKVPDEPATLSGHHVLADALSQGTAWVLEYAGKTEDGDRRGRALYFIVEYQNDELLKRRQEAIAMVDATNELLAKTTGKELYTRPSTRVALGVKEVKGVVGRTVCCVDYKKPPTRPEDSNAVWVLIPCFGNNRGDGASKVYKIKNLKTQRFFGSVNETAETKSVELVDSSNAAEWVLRAQGE